MAARQRVLVVEDDPAERRMYRTALGLAGFDVIEVEDGLHALHQLDQHPPDIVVLDLMLPTISASSCRRRSPPTRTRATSPSSS